MHLRWILAIDDSPKRYTQLAHKLHSRAGIFVTHDPETVDFYLNHSPYKFCGILLDHDMPIENGGWFAEKYFIDRNIPVVVTSHNLNAAISLEHFLVEWGVPTLRSPAPASPVYDDWIQQVLNHFGGFKQWPRNLAQSK